MKATITINEKYNGIEIKFTEKPEKEVREQLKDNGFKWHNKNQLWYARNTEHNLALAQSLAEEPAADRPAVVLATFAAPTFGIPSTAAEQPDESQEEHLTLCDTPAQPEEKTLHGVKIGDLFYTSWGWEQTNVDFFQVIGFKGKQSVVIRQVAPLMVEEEAVSGMSANRAYALPCGMLPPSSYSGFVNDNVNGDTRRLMVSKYDGEPYFKVGRKGTYQDIAYPYHGEKLYESWYA